MKLNQNRANKIGKQLKSCISSNSDSFRDHTNMNYCEWLNSNYSDNQKQEATISQKIQSFERHHNEQINADFSIEIQRSEALNQQIEKYQIGNCDQFDNPFLIQQSNNIQDHFKQSFAKNHKSHKQQKSQKSQKISKNDLKKQFQTTQMIEQKYRNGNLNGKIVFDETTTTQEAQRSKYECFAQNTFRQKLQKMKLIPF